MRVTTLQFAKTLTKSAIRATEQTLEVKAPWGKIAAITWGNPSNPPVLLCPGGRDTCATYRPLVNLLPEDYFYVGVDLPGNGLSDPFPRGAKLNELDFLQAIIRTKDHFKWDEFLYVGHSLGAVITISWGNPSNPPVLLCPGRFDTCATYRPLVNLLPEDYFYVGVDLPGNGLSDPFPRGAKLHGMDFLQAIIRMKDHFKWDEFFYIGHSLGAAMSKFYNIIYPGQMKRIVELDPMPSYIPTDDFRDWYLDSYVPFYDDEQYHKVNSGYDNAPKYKYEEVKARLMKARGVDEEIIEYVLERCLKPAGDGLFRLTFDQRLKLNFLLPFPRDYLIGLYTASKTPTLAILSSEFKDLYKEFPLSTDDSAWPHKNYKHVMLDVGHDVHLHSTAECSELITNFFKGSSNN